MGEFSWMLADKDNKTSLKIGASAYLACPDGSFIFEDDYDGYGNFGGHDAYELVVDWNRDFLDESMLQKPQRNMWTSDEEGHAWFNEALQRYGTSVKRLYDWRSHNVTSDEMAQRYGRDWKRLIGIDIACYDEQNAELPYPIKITDNRRIPYDELPASNGDPNQGWSDDESDEDDW